MTTQARHRRRIGRRLGSGIQNAVILLIMVLSIAPFLWVASNSIKPRALIYEYPPRLVFTPTFEHYIDVFANFRFQNHFRDSVIVAGGSTAIALVAGSLVAYAIARFRIGGTPFRFFLLAMRTLPGIAIIIPLYAMFRDLGLLDTYWALIIVYPVYMTPLVAWMMIGFFREVPLEMEEAASIDGCSQWGVFWRIVVPVTLPGFVAAAILNFIGGWNEFLFSLILTGRNVQTTPVASAGFISNKDVLWGQMAAAGVAASIPVIAFTIIVQRWLVRGLTLGAVK